MFGKGDGGETLRRALEGRRMAIAPGQNDTLSNIRTRQIDAHPSTIPVLNSTDNTLELQYSIFSMASCSSLLNIIRFMLYCMLEIVSLLNYAELNTEIRKLGRSIPHHKSENYCNSPLTRSNQSIKSHFHQPQLSINILKILP